MLSYIGEFFTSDERRNKDIDARIGKADAVLLERYCFVVTTRDLRHTEKLSV